MRLKVILFDKIEEFRYYLVQETDRRKQWPKEKEKPQGEEGL